MSSSKKSVIALLAAVLLVGCGGSQALAQLTSRIKDIADFEGVRGNKLFGLGLVTGLQGTGGKNPITRQMAQNFQQKMGIRADPIERLAVRTDAQVKTDNLSAVTVTVELPAFAKRGQQVDAIVSAYDDASSLQGGTLMPTELFAVDGQVYALASGPISVGGFSFGGQAANVQKNHPTTGRVPNGASIENEVPFQNLAGKRFVRVLTRDADFETARRIAEAINLQFPVAARAEDGRTIEVLIPPRYVGRPAAFMAQIGSISIAPDVEARVVINERTGTVVVGDNVRLSRVAVAHANLAVIIGETPDVSQPAPFSQGTTEIVPRTDIEVTEESNHLTVVEETTSVGELAQALNVLGVTPRDLSAIFQKLKQAGALHARLIFE